MTPIFFKQYCVIVLLAAGLSSTACAANDTTFYSGPELGARLLTNVVRISVLDINEHGFGLVVAAQTRHVYILTARHVVEPRATSSVSDADPAQRRIEVAFCAGDNSGVLRRSAEVVKNFDAGGTDIALLRVLRPPDYQPVLRAVAAVAEVEPRSEAWLLGHEQKCGVVAGNGAIASLRDARDNLLVEFPAARGGDSGGPAIGGYGVLGLVTDADDATFIVHSIASLETRLRAQSSDWWQLQWARNVPLTDPRSAEIDLSEMLNQYLFAARNLQGLLLQPSVPRPRFLAFSDDYIAAVNRFRDARERHDGTLKRNWPASVLPQWQTLREQLWQVHQPFWDLNKGDAQAIFDRQKSPAAVQIRMQSLEPELVQLQAGIGDFLKHLGQRSTP